MQRRNKVNFLNSREIKELNQRLKEQHGCSFEDCEKERDGYRMRGVFLRGGKDKIFMTNEYVGNIDISKLRVDKVGLYVCTDDDFGLRLSLEGSQILGPHANKNVITLDDKQCGEWLQGKEVELREEQIAPKGDDATESDRAKVFIVKHNAHGRDDFMGASKLRGNILLNCVPKERRVGALF